MRRLLISSTLTILLLAACVAPAAEEPAPTPALPTETTPPMAEITPTPDTRPGQQADFTTLVTDGYDYPVSLTDEIRTCEATTNPDGIFMTNNGPAVEGDYISADVGNGPEDIFVVGRLCGAVTLRDNDKGTLVGGVFWLGTHGGKDVYMIKQIMIVTGSNTNYIETAKPPGNNIDQIDFAAREQQWFASDTDLIEAFQNPDNHGMQMLIWVQLRKPGSPTESDPNGVAIKKMLDGGPVPASIEPSMTFRNIMAIPPGFNVPVVPPDS